ncbi:MAG TPA: DsbA family oxidoreductase, partial [Polyangiaceae bacterium]
MNVEIWSDLICPWCGVGQRRLERAIEGFEHREQVAVRHRSFELDPRPRQTVRSVREMLKEKYGWSPAQMEAAFQRIEGLAAEEGIRPYHVGDNLSGNTRLAHELLAFASQQGKEHHAWARLYRAYFGEQRSIFDVDSLVALGGELGLDMEEVRLSLSDGRFSETVLADEREARALGCTGVPFVVID